ncbi:uncharacterized protein LOC127264886 [Andrographis paniculata]|uniref:uncharacterized protein LOC127264886 n=1 Tax=Andrographis paniculata TaxID=175694 RepID=UPI0021E931BA|nr:uncharacterized protein LOC127264886 [Andrographis paniculata]
MAVYAAAGRSSGPVIRSITIAPTAGFGHRYSAHSPPSAAAPPCRRTCLCAPTNHPGSFRCSRHKGGGPGNISQTAAYGSSGGRNISRPPTGKNSPAPIGGAEGNLVKKALAALIRPSLRQQRRRGEFRCGRSRLSVMSKA